MPPVRAQKLETEFEHGGIGIHTGATGNKLAGGLESEEGFSGEDTVVASLAGQAIDIRIPCAKWITELLDRLAEDGFELGFGPGQLAGSLFGLDLQQILVAHGMRANGDQGIRGQAAELIRREHTFQPNGNLGMPEPIGILAKAAGWDEEGPGNAAFGKLRGGVFQDTDETVVERDRGISLAMSQVFDRIKGDGLSELEQDIHLAGEQSAMVRRNAVVIEHGAAGRDRPPEQSAEHLMGEVPAVNAQADGEFGQMLQEKGWT